MIRKFQVALAVLLIAGAVSSAWAQYEEDRPSRFGVRVVNFRPFDSDIRSARSMLLGVGLDWNLRFDEDGRPLSYLTAGILSADRDPNKFVIYPLTYTVLRRHPISATRATYAGYGAGLYRLKHSGARRQGFYYQKFSERAFKPGIHVLYGQEFRDTYFVELELHLLQKWSDTDWGGIYISVGTRTSM